MVLSDVRYGASLSGTERAYGATRPLLLPLSFVHTVCPILLRACYAMSGTAIPYATLLLRASYALSSTDLLYASFYALCDVRQMVTLPVGPYAMSVTDIGYAATRLLRDVRY
eukprot:1879891-Rhodomonas_salina.1